MKKNEVEQLKERFGCSNAFGVSSRGKDGGLCMYWREEVEVTIISFSQNHICGDISYNGARAWRFVGVYGWPKEEDKHRTWSLLRYLCGEADVPVILGGDFNEIMSYEEKEGGSNRERREMVKFREVADDCNLKDLGYGGLWYTWERGTSVETRIRERLDRFLASHSWEIMFSNARVEHLMRYKSDHTALLLRHEGKERKKSRKKEFKFETRWLLDDSCEHAVKGAWDSSVGCSILDKLAAVSRELVVWSGEKYDKLGKKISKIEKELYAAQKQPITMKSCVECTRLEKELDELNDKFEAYWYIRSLVSEVRDGDRNTKYFHHKASQRKKRNRIKGLFDNENN